MKEMQLSGNFVGLGHNAILEYLIAFEQSQLANLLDKTSAVKLTSHTTLLL